MEIPISQPFLLEDGYIALSCLKLLETFLNITLLGRNFPWLIYVLKNL